MNGPCVLWRGRLDRQGYGRVPNKRSDLAHRWIWELLFGPIPDGLELDHLCRMRACVNPDHLELVTHRENVLRGASPAARNAVKMACPEGHLYDRTRADRTRTGKIITKRVCSRCVAASSERYRARRRQEVG